MITKTFSNFLIIISVIVTILYFNYNELIIYWMSDTFLAKWLYQYLIAQFLLYSFIHWSFFHLLFNSVFIYYFWNIIEYRIGIKRYILFFLITTILIWLALLRFSSWVTIWISWFWLSLLTYYTLMLYYDNNSEYKWWITAIIINVMIWLSVWISFIWHLFWVIIWFIYFFIIRYYQKTLH